MSPQGRYYLGLLFWAGIAVLGIYLRGIRWEESFERAQALLGLVPYPEGHPLYRYAHGAIGFHYYVTASLMRFWPDPAFVCGYRSVLSAWFAILPVYVVGVVLTRRVWLGHLSALLSVAGIHLFFCSYYGLQVWPDKFTAGTIGQGYAVLILAALCARRWTTALLMLGVMPVVHLGHMPVVLGVGGLALAWLCWSRPDGWHRALLAFLGGLVCSLLFVVAVHHASAPVPTDGPFFSGKDPLEVWRRFTYFEDIHRAPTTTPRFGSFANSLMALAGLLLVSVALCRRDGMKRNHPSPWWWIFLCAAGSALAVFAAKGAQYFLGPDTPYLLIGWLPYRSPNLCAVLLVPVLVYAVTVGARTYRSQGALWNGAVLAVVYLALRPVLHGVVPETLYARYVAPPETMLFFLFGAALEPLWRGLEGTGRFRVGWSICVGMVVVLLGLEHQFGVLLVVVGFGTFVLLNRLSCRPAGVWQRGAVVVAAIVLLGTLLLELHRDYLPALENSPFDDDVAALLAAESQPGELLLTPHWHLNWQEKLHHPVFTTFETPYFLPYMRDLAGTLEKMMEDAYGIRFGEAWDYQLEVWKTRARAEWQALGERYAIRYVLSPNSVPLDLTPVLEGDTLTLYRVR